MVRHGEVINPVSSALMRKYIDFFVVPSCSIHSIATMNNQGGDRAVFYGALDVPLSPLGEMEAIEAASYLSRFHLQHVASSPLSRARFGARQVLERQSLPGDERNGSIDSADVVVLGGLRELDRGSWCGLTKEEIGPDMLARFDACDESVTPGDGGESYPALKSRVIDARDELLRMTEAGGASAIVSHLQVTRAMLSEALGMDATQMSTLKIATASISCVDYCSVTGKEVVRFQSFKPECGLEGSKDGAN